MSINPYILLGIGSAFALLYGLTITIGWAITRRNRRLIHKATGISRIPLLSPGSNIKAAPQYVETFSLTANDFYDTKGDRIDVTKYQPYIAAGESAEYPDIKSGDLVLMDSDHRVKYVFHLPSLTNYR